MVGPGLGPGLEEPIQSLGCQHLPKGVDNRLVDARGQQAALLGTRLAAAGAVSGADVNELRPASPAGALVDLHESSACLAAEEAGEQVLGLQARLGLAVELAIIPAEV